MPNKYICEKCHSQGRLYCEIPKGFNIYFRCGHCQVDKILYNYRVKNYSQIKEVCKMSKIYSVPELAKKYNRTSCYIRYLVRGGRIPFYEIGGHIRFAERDIPDIDYYFANFVGKRGRHKLIKKEEVNNNAIHKSKISKSESEGTR